MKRKLVVNRETLRNLDATDLKEAGGGISTKPTLCNCNVSISCYSCNSVCC
jgi:hypothetical protein